ncbi:MAG TPA: YegS/Rv2252/BmrU family lipid kinase [Candidatus Limnocylindrales bacterium]|jgi:YegS/Rv2252/BmrU family lipid kinase
MAPPYKRIHVVINPASGKGEPVLKYLADVCREHDVDWDISITRNYGDATQQARDALARGVDLVIGHGGDGTQHEIANAVMDSGKPMGILPGGTGNGFATEMGIPKDYRKAVEVLCTSSNVRRVDIMRIGDQYGIQRLYAGIEPEQQVSREQKNKYGTVAYAMMTKKQMQEAVDAPITLTIDGQRIDTHGLKCYVVNSGRGGMGSIDKDFSVDDGILDVFVLSRNPMSFLAAAERLLQVPSPWGKMYYWRGKDIRVECEPSKALWVDGEEAGRTPVDVKVLPGGLAVVVP